MKNLNNIADEMIKEGTKNTVYGNWNYYGIDEYDGVELKDLTEEEYDLLVELIASRDEVAEVDADDDCISVYFYTDYCPQTEH